MLPNSACKQNSLLWLRGYLCVPSLGYGASQRNCMLLSPASLLSENVAHHLQRSMSLWLNIQPMKHISAKILKQCSKHSFLLKLKHSQRKFKHPAFLIFCAAGHLRHLFTDFRAHLAILVKHNLSNLINDMEAGHHTCKCSEPAMAITLQSKG